jgi:hypothetical protein
MAVVRKDDVFQVRCRTEDLAAFEDACRTVNIKPTECVRRFMAEYVERVKRKEAAKAQYEAAKASRPGPVVAVPPVPEKSPVEPLRQPQSLSERRKAEKLAKQAKIAKREGRYLEE